MGEENAALIERFLSGCSVAQSRHNMAITYFYAEAVCELNSLQELCKTLYRYESFSKAKELGRVPTGDYKEWERHQC